LSRLFFVGLFTMLVATKMLLLLQVIFVAVIQRQFAVLRWFFMVQRIHLFHVLIQSSCYKI